MLTDIRLQHFRSYSDRLFSFHEGVNIIVGPNGSGKTNLLEAVLVLSSGSSYRAKDTELIGFDEPWARLDATLIGGETRTVKLVADPLPSKSYAVAGKPFKRLTMPHRLPLVLFEPNHLQLLAGSPEQRRVYLDDILEQTIPGYGTIRRQYKRTLAQRNALLKLDSASLQQLFPWNVRLSQLAGQIVRARTVLVSEIETRLSDVYRELSGGSTIVSANYHAQYAADGYETNLLKKLETSSELDRIRGFTSAGPHRDDLRISYDEHPINETASRGEARTGVLALKIIELQIIEAAREQTPLLLLDDVFSELDTTRRKALTMHLSGYQTFITTTDADVVSETFAKNRQMIYLVNSMQ